MPRTRLPRQRLLVLFLTGVLLLFSPLALLLEQAGTWRGIPVLFLYLFGVWAAIIAMAAAILARGRDW